MTKDTLTIEYCHAYLVDVPLRTQDKYGADAPFPFGVSYGTVRGLKRVLLELSARRSDKSVVRGFGEASPFYPYSNETALSVYELLTFYYATYLVGQTIALHSRDAANKDVNRILQGAEHYLSKIRLNFTQTAIDYALHDLAGNALNMPAYALLTDTPHLGPVRVCWSTSSRATIEENVEDARRFSSKGYAIKIKLNGVPDEDAERTTAIIHALDGSEVSVRADANAGFSPEDYLAYTEAVQRKFSQGDIERVGFYVEEPIDTRVHGRIRFIELLEESPYRLMADETLYTLEDAHFLVEESRRVGRSDRMLFNIKVQKVGGLRNAMKVAKIAREHDIPIMIGGMLASSFGKLANCHYAIAVGEVLDSDGVHPSKDYIDPTSPIIHELDTVEQMDGGSRVMEVFRERSGFGAQVDLEVVKRNMVSLDFGNYYADLDGFR